MTQIKTKRVYEAYQQEYGFRILVDKLWPRGVKKENLLYDYWAKEIEPSTTLRQWFHEDKINHWALFQARYTEELDSSKSAFAFIEKIKSYPVVTLIYAAKDQEHNHVLILQRWLLKHL